jgi:hypothetical protein
MQYLTDAHLAGKRGCILSNYGVARLQRDAQATARHACTEAEVGVQRCDVRVPAGPSPECGTNRARNARNDERQRQIV